MKKVFSGIRPTGNIHIGNYLGAISQWIQLQEENDCIFSIVDWHAITTPYNESTLQDTILETASIYLACGIDPKKCILFIQSDVKQHTELTWLLGSITPLGELQRMTQFKDKSKKHKEYINAGLLNYPILMASDILLYDADIVPVGKDQTQHVELTRNIAQKFNKKYGKTFTLPESLISKEEGNIREIIRQIQQMRKDNGFIPEDRINIYYASNEFFDTILERNKEHILREVLADKLILSNDQLKEIKIDNNKIYLNIKKYER
jgi:tryptophanyl-tRNA synthetase